MIITAGPWDRGVVACVSRYNAQHLGVCTEGTSDRNRPSHYRGDYSGCAADHPIQVDFCPSSGLHFLPCDQLKSHTYDKRSTAEVSDSQQAEETRKFLREVLVHHPDVARNLTKRMNDGLSWLFSGADQQDVAATPRPSSAPVSPPDGDALLEEADAERKARLSRALPWLITGGASLSMMLCTGLAVGALCHAALSHRSARVFRSPLLQDQRTHVATELERRTAQGEAE